jgi:hypothetical protein
MFRNEIGRRIPTTYYGYGYKRRGGGSLPDIVYEHGPFDAVITYDAKYCGMYKDFDKLTIPTFCVQVDYLDRNAGHLNKFINKHRFDGVFLRSPYSYRLFEEQQAEGKVNQHSKPHLLLFGADLHNFPEVRLLEDFGNRGVDVASIQSLSSWAYPRRTALVKYLNSLIATNVLIKGTGSRDKLRYLEYLRTLARTKIFVVANGVYRSVTIKYYEAMGCGCLLMVDRPRDHDEYGFIDRENIVFYEGLADLDYKIKFYLGRPEERKRIANNGYHYALKNSMASRVEVIRKAIEEAHHERVYLRRL